MTEHSLTGEDAFYIDLRHIRETMRWSHWPMCPMVKPSTSETGFLFDFGPDGWQSTVLIGNMFEVIQSIQDERIMTLKDLERRTYPSVISMLKDGWRVD